MFFTTLIRSVSDSSSHLFTKYATTFDALHLCGILSHSSPRGVRSDILGCFHAKISAVLSVLSINVVGLYKRHQSNRSWQIYPIVKSEPLRIDLTRSDGGSLTDKTVDEVLAAIKRLADREENALVSDLFFRPIRFLENFYFMKTANIPVYGIVRCMDMFLVTGSNKYLIRELYFRSSNFHNIVSIRVRMYNLASLLLTFSQFFQLTKHRSKSR